MHVLIFDPFHGAAGDMITAALLDCGADRQLVMQAMQAVVAEPGVTEVTRAGIRAIKVDTHSPSAHRTFSEVMTRIDAAASDVPGEALAMAKRVFRRINDAEVKVHGKHVHFHEVGADDAIADVIGACTALHSLGVDGVAVMPIALGQGVAMGSHGVFPIPAPATVAILTTSGLLTRPGREEGELCTPTGAALLVEFSSIPVTTLGTYSLQSVGYGAGTRDYEGIPNVIRAMIVETVDDSNLPSENSVDILETNVDDVSGEIIAHAITRCLECGARDASAIPVVMKKGRPGFLFRVICTRDKSVELSRLMAMDLATLGIRCIPAVHRFFAERKVVGVTVEIDGNHRVMPVKFAWLQDEMYSVKAEFDQARDWAAELGVPVRDVIRAVENAGRKSIKLSTDQVPDED
jgi:uncharacterized protein (TIGR00299 family) protein